MDWRTSQGSAARSLSAVGARSSSETEPMRARWQPTSWSSPELGGPAWQLGCARQHHALAAAAGGGSGGAQCWRLRLEFCSAAAVESSLGRAGASSVARLRLRSIWRAFWMALLRNDSISGAVQLQEQSFDDCSYAGETSCNNGTVMPLLLIKYLGHSLKTYRMPLRNYNSI